VPVRKRATAAAGIRAFSDVMEPPGLFLVVQVGGEGPDRIQ
jgi:hypothetical protein